jgi:hypothetical protein
MCFLIAEKRASHWTKACYVATNQFHCPKGGADCLELAVANCVSLELQYKKYWFFN